MIDLRGKYNTAKIFTDNIENDAIRQITDLCNQEFVENEKIRIMPDVHPGYGCTVGTTLTVKDKVVPNLVGVDIGCGMYLVKLKNKHIELDKLDKVIKKYVVSGLRVRGKAHDFIDKTRIDDLICIKQVNMNKARLSIGTLGSGNHFIEVDKDKDGSLYLVIHSGSRLLGKQVATYYQRVAVDELTEKRNGNKIREDLAYLEGKSFDDYIHDMKITQEFADWNRKAIADIIIREMKFKVSEEVTTIHNYIDTKNMILRKGAISAQAGEKLLIPLNMRDGAILAVGKGNKDWNYSAPHGAGRLMSRSDAKDTLTMEKFKEDMKGIFTTSVSTSTLDEAPSAYKPAQEILDNIGDTVEIIDVIKPIYNYKDS